MSHSLLILPLLLALQTAPEFTGDLEPAVSLGDWVDGALRSTEAFGTWPEEPWSIHLHTADADFERATGSPAGRSASWVGATLHLRPWAQLQRRDLGVLLRHELTHRRLAAQGLPRWKEEALCLWAEDHTRLPDPWPVPPDAPLQKRLDTALLAGTTASQHWAYAWLRAWLRGRPLPKPPEPSLPQAQAWQPDRTVTVIWPPERLPRKISVNEEDYVWKPSARYRFQGEVRFGPGMPVTRLAGEVGLEAAPSGWRMAWTTSPETWIAAATEGELGSDAPLEAKRALAAVLREWLKGHLGGQHPDGSLCPLTHCAVIRGQPTPEGLQAVAEAPSLELAPDQAFFTGSKGGISWSPREAWGAGSALAGSAQVVPGDPWANWVRVVTKAQVRHLKASVRPGLLPGQRGIRLGTSGPYPVEALRLEAGRRFGWTAWPSNACEGSLQPDGSLLLQGHGWGHNVGLCLATVLYRARKGDRAEEILQEAFGRTKLHFLDPRADPEGVRFYPDDASRSFP
jgi:hypothetical protein